MVSISFEQLGKQLYNKSIMEVRTRSAPSPTGYPHVGTLYQALFHYVFAKKYNGKFIIRIEDTDMKRFVPGAEDVIYESFEWAGLIPDEGPKYGGEFGPYRQSERLDIYKKYAQILLDNGFAYYCFCSEERLKNMRKEQQMRGAPPKYDRRCLELSQKEIEQKLKSGEKGSIRMKIPDVDEVVVHDLIRGVVKFKAEVLDDQVLLKSDGFPTYHLAVVIDDHLMKISHTVRGEEWLPSAPKHILLYQMLGWKPPKFVHLPLLRNPDRTKISKRYGHTSVFWYREQGYLPEALLNFLALIVWNHPENKEVFDLQEMAKYFKFEDMSTAAPIVNLDKLDWLNGVYIRSLTPDELLSRLKSHDLKHETTNKEYLRKIIPLIQERMKKLSEFEELTDFFFADEIKVDEKLLVQKNRTPDETKKILSTINNQLSTISPSNWNHEKLEQIGRSLCEELGWKPKDLFMTLRIAITGKIATPPLFETMEVLGKGRVFKRLEKAIALL